MIIYVLAMKDVCHEGPAQRVPSRQRRLIGRILRMSKGLQKEVPSRAEVLLKASNTINVGATG
jgi:hypothetical protein